MVKTKAVINQKKCLHQNKLYRIACATYIVRACVRAYIVRVRACVPYICEAFLFRATGGGFCTYIPPFHTYFVYIILPIIIYIYIYIYDIVVYIVWDV